MVATWMLRISRSGLADASFLRSSPLLPFCQSAILSGLEATAIRYALVEVTLRLRLGLRGRNSMETRLIRIGNSGGIRIPTALIEAAGLKLPCGCARWIQVVRLSASGVALTGPVRMSLLPTPAACPERKPALGS